MSKKVKLIDLENFNLGLRMREDETKAPVGSAREMSNMIITDRGGIAKREGTELLGSNDTANYGLKGFYNYVKSNGQEVFLKSYSTGLLYYNTYTSSWATLKGGFSSGQEFGFREHNVNTDNEDYVYLCNRTEDYQRWNGAHDQLTIAMGASTTEATVTSLLYDDVFYSGSATVGASSSLDVTGFAADQWNTNFYVYIKSGGADGKISQIDDTSSTGITFTALSSSPVPCSFEIRKPRFPASGTLVIGGADVTYTAIPDYNKFTVTASTSAYTTASPVALKPSTYPADPRGNRMDSLFTRMFVGNVRSALALSTAGTLGGNCAPTSVYYSKIKDATDFTFSATRVAGEGGIESLAYGKGSITDVACQEETAYIFTKNYVEAMAHEQSSSDLVTRQPVSTVLGSVNRAVKGENDIYFATEDKQITSIGRIANKDTREQNINIGYPVKRLLDTYNVDDFNGIKFENRIFFTAKDADSELNERVLVYNEKTGSFEGEWTLGAYGFATASSGLYYASAGTPNIYKMFTGLNDAQGTDVFPITSTWKSNWINLTASKANQQAINALSVEGYITPPTTITISLYRDHNDTAALSFDFIGTETGLIDSNNFQNFLGARPLGLAPLGAVSATDEDNRYHFQFLVYFPPIYGNFYSLGVSNSGTNQDFEITRMSLGITEDVEHDLTRI